MDAREANIDVGNIHVMFQKGLFIPERGGIM